MSFISYAENCIDVMLWRALRSVEEGFYVVIGAGNPEASITRAFYEQGWSGINAQTVDEYFQRLIESRPRDTSLKVATVRESRLRILKINQGKGVSSVDPAIGLQKIPADLPPSEVVVPELTLTQIIEKYASPTIHFLLVDVDAAGAEVLEGLDLKRVRPWIILVGAISSDPNISPREQWEHLITGRGYSFTFFDGFNCFYVADETSGVKERLVPPNFFDEFVRSQEQFNGQRVKNLEHDLAGLRSYSAGLETSLKDASTHSARLEKLLMVTRSEAAKSNTAVQAERAQVDYLLDRLEQLEAGSDRSNIARGVEHLFKRLRSAGDQLTRGGLRALAKRMAAKLARYCRQNPRINTIAHAVLKPIPGATAFLSNLEADDSSEKIILSDSDEQVRYNRWIAVYDAISATDRSLIRAHISGLAVRPLISVVISTAGTSHNALRDSFNSVFTQLYAHWELCVAVDELAEARIEPLLGFTIASDSRIKLVRSNSLPGAASAINAALDLATGDFLAFLEAGDILPEHALYEVAFSIVSDQRIDILYTDHDYLNTDGQRSNPWFKPDWDPDLLLAQYYIGNLAVYRRMLVEAIGYLRPEFEDAELYDLALRATAATKPDRVHYVPAILYHRRSEKETSGSKNALPVLCAIRGAHRAERDHLDSLGNTKTLLRPAPQAPHAIRILWPVPEPPPLVSVIVPTRDQPDLLAQCVEGVLQRTDYPNLELLIIDNGSIEPATAKLFDRLSSVDPRVRIVRYPGPFNFAALNNAGARTAKGEVLLLLNNDTDIIESDWLREMVSHALRPDVGIVGAKLIYANESIQHGGVTLGQGQVTHVHRFASRNDPGYFGQLSLTRTLSAVTGACVAIRRAVFFEVGGFDEINLQIGFNDIDLCLRLRDYGYRVVWTPFAELFHLESVSRGYDDFPELFQLESVSRTYDAADPVKRERATREWQHMHNTWGAMMEFGDPFHNPNLRFHWDHLEIPSSPRREKPWRSVYQPLLAPDESST